MARHLKPEHDDLISGLAGRALPPLVDDKIARQWIDGLCAHPIMAQTGLRATLLDGGLVRFDLDELQDYHLGGFSGTRQVVNGAVLSAMVDGICGAVANLHARKGGAATVDISTQFMRATTGPTVTGYGAAVSRGTKLAFVEALIIDGKNTVTARSTATCTVSST